MGRIPSASTGGVRVTPYSRAVKSRAEENERSSMGEVGIPETTKVIRLFVRELSPLADEPLTDNEANFSDLSGASVSFPILGDECPSPTVSSEVDEFSEASSFEEETDENSSLSVFTQRFMSVSPASVGGDRIPSSIFLENLSERVSTSVPGLNLVRDKRGVLYSANKHWSAEPEPSNEASHRYKLKNIVNQNSVEFFLEFASLPSKNLVSNPVFLNRNGEEWFAYVGEGEIYLYFLRSSDAIEKRLKYEIKNISAMAMSPDGKYFAVADIYKDESAISIWQIDGLDRSVKKIFSKLEKFRIKNMVFSPDDKLVAAAGVKGINKYIIQIFSLESEAHLDTIEESEPINDMVFERSREGYDLRIQKSEKSNFYDFSSSLNSPAMNPSRQIFVDDSLAVEDIFSGYITDLV